MEIKLCECGCGEPAPIAERNWHTKGIVKGQPLRFVCGHHNRGVKQSLETKLKRTRSWGTREASISPYLPDNKVVRFAKKQKRWYCCAYGKSSTVPHARLVFEYFYGSIPEGYVVHHKSGTAASLEDDRPENLMLLTKKWNLRYLPLLAQGFAVPESEVTVAYIQAVETVPSEQVFEEVCRILLTHKNLHV